MGNSSSHFDDSEWKFRGRKNDIDIVKNLLQKKRSILIFGLKKIGKSRLIKKIFQQLNENNECIYKDFELDNTNDGQIVSTWLHEFLAAINVGEEKSNFPSIQIACRDCDMCKNNVPDKCRQRDDKIKAAIQALTDKLNKEGKKTVLFLDNVDNIMNSALKDFFLHFLKQLMKRTKLRTIVTSSTKPMFTERGFEAYELKPLNREAICEILFETCECRDLDENLDSGEDEDLDTEEDEKACMEVSYSLEHTVFKEENEPYIIAIVGLCEGLPLAAIMSGMLLNEDDGLITPADLVVILICMRLEGLSPDNCPSEDRLEIYKIPMEQVKGVVSFFNSLNENLVGNDFSIDMAVEVAIETEDGVDIEAMAKQKVLKPCLNRSVLSIQRLSGDQQLKWHGILRECQAALQTIDNIPSGKEVSEAKGMVLKFMKENVTKAGLDFDEEVLTNPKYLEQAIKNLSISPPVQATDEKKRLSISEENDLASKEVMHDTKTTVLKDVREKDIPTDVQNNPDMDSKSSKKLKYRYQLSEEKEDELEFEVNSVIYERQPEITSINDINRTKNFDNEQIFDDPPPYTSRPSPVEPNPAHDMHNISFQHLRDQPRVNNVGGSPPPSYHSTFSNHQNNNAQYDPQNVTLNKPETKPSRQRSNSLSQTCGGKFYIKDEKRTGENTQQVVHNRQYKDKWRPRSDPRWDRLYLDSKMSDLPRKEIDIPASDSLTGPPGLNYIPPDIHSTVSNGIQDSSRYIGESGSLNIKTSEETFASANLQIGNLKEDLLFQTTDEKASGFSVNSTVGPAAMSYKFTSGNDLHSNQGNEGLTPKYGAHDQRSVNSDVSQDNEQSGSRLSVKHEDNVSQRRSPTAIVSPMPRRHSPPNVTKQMQSERPVQNVTPFRRN